MECYARSNEANQPKLRTKCQYFFLGPVLTITAARPREDNGPVHTSLPLINDVDHLGTGLIMSYLPQGLGFLCSLRAIKFNIVRSLPTI